jgi:GH15 family glucan-1,4-alpha-glucosidase
MVGADGAERAEGGYPPIADYAFIGDCHSTALVSASGSIDWACMRRFDAGGVFCRLLDTNKGGCFALQAANLVRSHRSYLEDSNVLETVFETDSGRARVLDCFTMHKGGKRAPLQQLLRIIEGLEGTVAFQVSITPRFDYGALPPWLAYHPDEDVYSAIGGDDAVVISANGPLTVDRQACRLYGQVNVSAKNRYRFSLVASMAHEITLKKVADRALDQRLDRTVQWWRRWVGKGRYHPEFRAPMIRSAIVLKALTCAPTGAIVAAPTTSLPESIGGERNWDYRFTWIRDATLTLSALFAIGHRDVARAFHRFIVRTTAGRVEDLQIMYSCYGERRLPELQLDHLDGYRGSRPVRVGNAASRQCQLDVYGELLDSWHVASQMGTPISSDDWSFLRALVEAARTHWSKPDQGLWEMRGPPRHFVHSKVMCWVALDRGVALAERYGLPADLEAWRRTRDEIRETIELRGVDPERGCYVQSFDSRELDASLLLLPMVGFIDANNPRMQATVAAIQKELSDDGLLIRRYRRGHPDGLSGDEGTFMMVSFWMVQVLAMQGQGAAAKERFGRLLALGNDVHLFPEEYQPGVGFLGNYPQAFTHVAIIEAAQQIADAETRGAAGRCSWGDRAAEREPKTSGGKA